LDSAINATLACATIDVNWHPYIIDLGTAKEGEDYLKYNQRRWGSDSWTRSLRHDALKEGCLFAHWKWWPNTIASHCFALIAEEEGKSDKAQDVLFQLAYEEGCNISQTNLLCDEAARRVGISCDEHQLNSKIEEVLKRDQAAKVKLRIKGVPYFIISNPNTGQKVSLSGAQSHSKFISVFNDLLI